METMDEIRDMLNDAIYGDYDENSERYDGGKFTRYGFFMPRS